MAAEVIMYESPACPYCRAARQLLDTKSVDYKAILVDSREVFEEMIERSGRKTVPQIFIGTAHVGGYDDILALERDEALDALLAG
ncbi:MAG: glutaredoxin 3 [Pseudomonadota bacterium]